MSRAGPGGLSLARNQMFEESRAGSSRAESNPESDSTQSKSKESDDSLALAGFKCYCPPAGRRLDSDSVKCSVTVVCWHMPRDGDHWQVPTVTVYLES